MRFLGRRAPDRDAAPEDRREPQLEAVAIFRADGVVEGSIQRGESRLSDDLNAGSALQVWLVGADGNREWQSLRADDVIAVAVPPHPDPSPKRMARRRHVLDLKAPPYLISGTVHMPPGADPARYARSTPHRWLAVTNAAIGFADDTFEVDVLLLNLDHVVRS